MKRWLLSGSTLASGVLAFGLLSVSPPGCGCMTPVMTLGHQLGMATAPSSLTAEQVRAAAERADLGRRLADITPPTALRDEPCVATESLLQCRYWLASGWLRRTGLQVSWVSDPQGRIAAVNVEEVTQWR